MVKLGTVTEVLLFRLLRRERHTIPQTGSGTGTTVIQLE